MSQILRNAASFIDDIPGVYVPETDFENTISELGMTTVMIAAGSLFVLTVIAMLFSKRFEKLKLPLFALMATAMAGSAIVLVVSTVVLNVRSDSGGPVHWHADTEFWACGNEIELRDPTGFLSNKIGTATLHEHDDHRIHLEGVVVDDTVDASLGKYMFVVGGAITAEQMVIPLNADGEGNLFEDEEDGDGPAMTDPGALDPYISEDPELGKIAYFQDGDTCNDVVSDVQVFVYNYDDETKTYEQRKLDNPRDYVITDDPNVPPGDCVIFEFGPEREKTDKLCEQYGIRDIDRCEQFGVSGKQKAICELTQSNFSSDDTLPVESTTAPQLEEDATEDAQEATEIEEFGVHQDPALESARLACEESRVGQTEFEFENPTDECDAYDQALSESAEGQAEFDGAQGPSADDTELPTELNEPEGVN